MYIYAATVPQDDPKLILYLKLGVNILVDRNTAFIHGVSFLILVPTQILQSILQCTPNVTREVIRYENFVAIIPV